MTFLIVLPPVVWTLLALVEERNARRLAAELGPRHRVVPRKFVLAMIGLFFAVFAIMGPAWGAAADEVKGGDIVVCLDVSRSMLARDVEPDRLTRAKREIRALADRAKGDRLGLVVFAGEARAMVPLTDDMVSFLELLDLADPTSVGRGGTDLGAALETALEVLQGRAGSVLLMTDGEDLGGKGLAAAKLLGERGVRVHAVGLGTELGSKVVEGDGFLRDRSGADVVTALDATGLRRIAEATGGTFAGAVPDLSVARRTERSERKENRYQWPLAIAVLLWVADLSRRRP